VNHKRVERLYAEEKLQVRRRKRKKVPVSERFAATMKRYDMQRELIQSRTPQQKAMIESLCRRM